MPLCQSHIQCFHGKEPSMPHRHDLPRQQLKYQEGDFALKLAKKHKLHQTSYSGTCFMNQTHI